MLDCFTLEHLPLSWQPDRCTNVLFMNVSAALCDSQGERQGPLCCERTEVLAAVTANLLSPGT